MTNSIDKIIDEVIEVEGGSKVSNASADRGGRTQYGVSEVSHPEAWEDGKVTEQEARDIYWKKYVVGPGFDKITFQPLQHQLVDFGVNSGPLVAVRKLQEILGVKVDGDLGPKTLAKLEDSDLKAVNNQLMVSRVRMLGKIVSKNRSQAEWINGWLIRATSFLL